MSIKVLPGERLPLNLLLEEGDTNKYPVAYVYDNVGNLVHGSPFSLIHIDKGLYLNNNFTIPEDAIRYYATYIVYNDEGHTEEDLRYFPRAQDIFDISISEFNIKEYLEEYKKYLISVLDIGKLEGVIEMEEDLVGIVSDDSVEAIIDDDNTVIGITIDEPISGEIEDNDIEGEIK